MINSVISEMTTSSDGKPYVGVYHFINSDTQVIADAMYIVNNPDVLISGPEHRRVISELLRMLNATERL